MLVGKAWLEPFEMLWFIVLNTTSWNSMIQGKVRAVNWENQRVEYKIVRVFSYDSILHDAYGNYNWDEKAWLLDHGA